MNKFKLVILALSIVICSTSNLIIGFWQPNYKDYVKGVCKKLKAQCDQGDNDACEKHKKYQQEDPNCE